MLRPIAMGTVPRPGRACARRKAVGSRMTRTRYVRTLDPRCDIAGVRRPGPTRWPRRDAGRGAAARSLLPRAKKRIARFVVRGAVHRTVRMIATPIFTVTVGRAMPRVLLSNCVIDRGHQYGGDRAARFRASHFVQVSRLAAAKIAAAYVARSATRCVNRCAAKPTAANTSLPTCATIWTRLRSKTRPWRWPVLQMGGSLRCRKFSIAPRRERSQFQIRNAHAADFFDWMPRLEKLVAKDVAARFRKASRRTTAIPCREFARCVRRSRARASQFLRM